MIDAPLYQAADEVLNYLSQLTEPTDENKPVFKSSGYGVWLPSDVPNADTVPALRVWVSNPGYNVTTEQLFTGERDCSISIGIYNWLPTHNILGASDGTVAADGITFTTPTGGFFGYDGYMIAIGDTQIAYINQIVNNNTVILDTVLTPGTNLNWWLRQSPVNPARVMVNYADYVVRWLQRKDITGDGFLWTPELWAPKPTQVIRPDYFGQLRKYNGNVPIQPPWFAVEIPLGADVWDTPIGYTG